MSKNSNALVEVALFAALAMVLSFVPDFLGWYSPSWGAIPLILLCLRRGAKCGLLAGFIWGLLHFVLGKFYFLSLLQVFLEYIVAFTAMGLAGYFASSFQAALKEHKTHATLQIALFAASFTIFVRYLIHYIAGVVYWGEYAPEGMSPFWYSFIVNGSAGAITLLAVLVALSLLVPSYPKFFLPKR